MDSSIGALGLGNRLGGRPAGKLENMYRTTIISACASAALLLSACGSGGASNSSDGIASLDTIAQVASDSESSDTDDANASNGGGESDGEVSEVGYEKAIAEYEQCLDDIGLGGLFADEGGDGVATDVAVESSGDGGALEGDPAELDAQFERMQEECDPIIAAVSQDFELSPEEEAELADADLAFARCMREAGFDFPDPGADGTENQVLEFDEDDLDIDALNETMDKCDSVFEEVFDENAEEL